MIGGFAMVAFPAQYGVTGIMTFIVESRRRRVPEGPRPNTATLAKQMKRFDPDESWKKVEPAS